MMKNPSIEFEGTIYFGVKKGTRYPKQSKPDFAG